MIKSLLTALLLFYVYLPVVISQQPTIGDPAVCTPDECTIEENNNE